MLAGRRRARPPIQSGSTGGLAAVVGVCLRRLVSIHVTDVRHGRNESGARSRLPDRPHPMRMKPRRSGPEGWRQRMPTRRYFPRSKRCSVARGGTRRRDCRSCALSLALSQAWNRRRDRGVCPRLTFRRGGLHSSFSCRRGRGHTAPGRDPFPFCAREGVSHGLPNARHAFAAISFPRGLIHGLAGHSRQCAPVAFIEGIKVKGDLVRVACVWLPRRVRRSRNKRLKRGRKIVRTGARPRGGKMQPVAGCNA